MATFLCTHLASHGYVVAALDHSELVAPELAPRPDESAEERTARVAGIIASRPQDVRFLLDHLLDGAPWDPAAALDRTRVGVVGYSFGGWTALQATELDPRIRCVVALAPGGASHPRPGIAPVTLAFRWGRELPALYVAGASDTLTPLDGIEELFARAPGPKQLLVLNRADHMHFVDEIDFEHELVRTAAWPDELSYIAREMRPIAQLVAGEPAQRFTRGLTLAHLDAVLRGRGEARRFLAGDLAAALAQRGIEAAARPRA